MEEHPDWTLTEIGLQLGVGRERTRQLLLVEGISIRDRKKVQYEIDRMCPTCGGIKKPESKVCINCYKSEHNVTCVCEVCGEEFVRYKSQAIREGGNFPRFCSRVCQGTWLGSQHGFKGK